jgi:hypothetical protein
MNPASLDGCLLEQLQNKLLLLVGLGQSGNAGLLQDGVFGQSRHRRGNVGGPDAVFRAGQVLHLVVDDIAGSLQPVHAGAQGAAQAGNGLNGRVDGA